MFVFVAVEVGVAVAVIVEVTVIVAVSAGVAVMVTVEEGVIPAKGLAGDFFLHETRDKAITATSKKANFFIFPPLIYMSFPHEKLVSVADS